MRPQLLINTIHAEVFDRTPGSVFVSASVKVDLIRFSADEGVIEYSYKLVISSRVGQVTSDGLFLLFAESEDEKHELEKLAEESKKEVPPCIVQSIVMNLQPLILLIEKEMGMPITPMIPHTEPQQAEKRKVGVPLYQ